MPSLKSIKKRINSVKSTQKITRAMKMVAAARLRKAQQRILELRPYAIKTYEVLSSVAARAGGEEAHQLLARRPPNKVLLVVLTSDRGLAGGFNANICRRAYQVWKDETDEHHEITFAVIGRKGRDFLHRRKANVRHEITGVFENLSYEKAAEIARVVIDEYKRADLDAVYLVYNEFKSAISQKVTIEQLLPIRLDHGAPPPESVTKHVETEAGSEAPAIDFIYEPDKATLLDRLLPMYVEVEVYRALLESVASEHGARMTAMDAATKNAGEMIDRMTLVYNRTRQAVITKELMEIIGGAEALKE
ncbi:MAG: ATP synthase F1 subunit gamma [Deltaproteobacteria bacterium]|nr:ATP synthase F1 subunit gamma [Deltaproteobacteria bacterium]